MTTMAATQMCDNLRLDADMTDDVMIWVDSGTDMVDN